MPSRRQKTLVFSAMSLIFFGPLILAYYSYFSGAGFVSLHKEHGQLLRPVLQISDLHFLGEDKQNFPEKAWRHFWSILYVSNQPQCDKHCMHSLFVMRQVRLRLGEKQTRVKRLILSQAMPSDLNQVLHTHFEGTKRVYMAKETFEKTFLGKEGLYLVDPLGNLMMRYPSNVGPKPLYEDLKHLLKISQIG
jgi:hypothetical protein